MVETNTGDSLEYGKYGLKTIVVYDADYEYIDVPSIYYRGYSVVFKDQAGNTVNVPYSNEGDNKSIRVYSNYVSAPGTLIVDYTGTTIQKASLALNVFFVLAVLFLIKWHKWIYHKMPVLKDISPL